MLVERSEHRVGSLVKRRPWFKSHRRLRSCRTRLVWPTPEGTRQSSPEVTGLLTWTAMRVLGFVRIPGACGEAEVTAAGASSTQRYTATTMVLERNHGPQLCVGAIGMSLPPVGGGPNIVGWDWTTVPHQSRSGVRWGDYRVVGSWDGSTLTLTEAATAVDRQTGTTADDKDDFSAPCPEPPGGWAPINDSLTTDDALNRATQVARRLDGHAGLWIDNRRAPDQEITPDGPGRDLQRLVLVVATTTDVAATEAAIREVWGGALCVTQAARTEAELRRVQKAVFADVPGVLFVGVDTVANQVEVGVLVATAELQQELDDTHGPGVVRLLCGALRPLDD